MNACSQLDSVSVSRGRLNQANKEEAGANGKSVGCRCTEQINYRLPPAGNCREHIVLISGTAKVPWAVRARHQFRGCRCKLKGEEFPTVPKKNARQRFQRNAFKTTPLVGEARRTSCFDDPATNEPPSNCNSAAVSPAPRNRRRDASRKRGSFVFVERRGQHANGVKSCKGNEGLRTLVFGELFFQRAPATHSACLSKRVRV